MKITPPFVRSAYNYDLQQACEECCVKDFGPSLTQQSQAEDADINNIVRRFGLTGQLPENHRVPQYADFDEIYDYKTAQDAIALANSSFNQMPPQLRNRFNNDPQTFLEFCSAEENLPELRRLGLAKPLQEEIVPTRSSPTSTAPDALGGAPGAGGVAEQSRPLGSTAQ